MESLDPGITGEVFPGKLERLRRLFTRLNLVSILNVEEDPNLPPHEVEENILLSEMIAEINSPFSGYGL